MKKIENDNEGMKEKEKEKLKIANASEKVKAIENDKTPQKGAASNSVSTKRVKAFDVEDDEVKKKKDV
jgi:hypothetical protein